MPSPRLRQLLFYAAVTAYFLYFTFDSLRVHFAPDDMANIAAIWSLPPVTIFFAPFMPWTAYYRPLAGWFYVGLLHGWGLNPLPYHVVMLAFLLGGVFLVHRLALQLMDDDTPHAEIAAALAALLVAYHAGLANLYYAINFVYDALCGFFFLAALVLYISIRRRRRVPGWRGTPGILLLYLFALQSKEMAVTLPAVLLLYEWFYPQPGARRSFAEWLRGPARTALFCGLLTLPYLYGRLIRRDALIHDAGYRLSFSTRMIWDFHLRAFADYFLTWRFFDRWWMFALLLLFGWVAWRRPSRVLRFCFWFFLVITPLPIEFLVGRAGACLYIPLVGWAIFVATVFTALAAAAARFLSPEPLIGKLGRPGLLALLLAAGVFLWAKHTGYLKRTFINPAMQSLGLPTADAIQQLTSLHLKPPSHATIVFLNDPFQDWDMAFIAQLCLRDRSLSFRLNRKTPLSPDDLSAAYAVIDYRDGRFIRVR